MAGKMNQAWWLSNKAKTLSDTGDTVSKALKLWDEAKKLNGSSGDHPAKIEKALTEIGKAATALKAKANKVLHKETIGTLDHYINASKNVLGLLKKADGTSLAKNMHGLPRNVMEQLKKFNNVYWVMMEDSLLFLNAMKSGKGSQKIFDDHIKDGAKHEVNISGPVSKRVIEAVKAGKWTDPAWKAAFDEVAAMMKKNGKDAATNGCSMFEKLLVVQNAAGV